MKKKDILERLNDRIHHLETLLKTQNGIITDLQRQVKMMRESASNIPAPLKSRCDCCSGIAMIVGKCGHYFCSMCLDRSHHVDCVICEMSIAEDNE